LFEYSVKACENTAYNHEAFKGYKKKHIIMRHLKEQSRIERSKAYKKRSKAE
jgi:hypothetical protein